MIGETIAHYRVTAKLGAGGMGEVYRATDTKLGREVAVKVLPEAFAADAQRMQRFQREAQLLASLNHPNIAAIYGLERRERIQALAMELVEGPTLAERIAAGAIPVEETLPIARQLAEALEYAHERGIIHRDLKPANIKLTAENKVKVLDFGLAKALADETSPQDASASPTLSVAATKAGIILGTAAYMSPEQARGKTVDRRADIWAYGVVLYEMLTGRQLYGGETASDSMAAVITREPDWKAVPGDVPPRVRELLRRCLTKDPKMRLRDIGEARIALDAKSSAEELALGVAPQWHKNRERVWMAAAAVLLVAAIGMSALYYMQRAATGLRPLRALILPAEGSTFGVGGGAGGPAVLSPDGKRLAYVAMSGGRRMLWVRPLDSLSPQQLGGTEEASFPFWSPDSRSIAFFTPGKLKKIDTAGGPPFTVCDYVGGSGARGGTWNRDGVILFTPNTNAGLLRVSANGGSTAPATTLDASRKEGTHRWPFFLPDQKHFLYLARALGPGNAGQTGSEGIYVGSLDGKENKLLVRGVSSAVYASGYVLFVREGALMAQPFDTGRLETTSDAVPLVEQVQFDVAFSLGAFSASENGTLSYHAGGALENSSKLQWLDRTGKETSVLGDPAMYYDERISPDGKKVAVSLFDPSSRNIDVWIYDVARGLRTRFTFDPAFDRFPVWSPDGSRVIFGSSRKGVYDLYVKPASGASNEELVASMGLNMYPTDWSADGRYVLCWDPDPKTGSDIQAVPMTGDHKPIPFLQTAYNESDGHFSPDGKWIAYMSNESGADQIYVAPFPGPGGKWQISPAGGTRPVWRQDGKEIVFLAPDDKLMAAEVSASGANFNVGAVRTLFPIKPQRFVTFFPNIYSASRDTRRFLVISAREQVTAAPVVLVVNWPADVKN